MTVLWSTVCSLTLFVRDKRLHQIARSRSTQLGTFGYGNLGVLVSKPKDVHLNNITNDL